MTSPVENFIERAVEAGRKVKRQGSHWLVSCPGPNHARGDREPSLHVSPGRNGGAVLRCFAGCDNRDIVEALGMTLSDLFDGPSSSTHDAPETDVAFYSAAYDYADVDGTVLYQVRRLQFLSGRKSFVQRQPDGAGWRNHLNGVERTLYRLPQLGRACTNGEPVWIVEGERDVESLVALGKVATTAGAATAWRDELVEHLRGARSVTVVADRDVPGYALALKIADALAADGWPAERVRVLISPFGKDVTEHLEAGHTLDELVSLADTEAPAELEPAEVDPDEAAIAAEVRRLRVRDEAARRHASAIAEREIPAHVSAATLLAQPEEPIPWRVEGLLTQGDNVLLAAERKTGKTTFTLNLVAALVEGTPFMGKATTGLEGTISYWDAELGARRFRQWLRALDIDGDLEGVEYLDLRATPFPSIHDDDVAADVAERLKAQACAVWIIDPAVHAIATWPTRSPNAESDNIAVTQFTGRLDEIKVAAGVGELVVVHHAGKDGTTRGRGASRWEDWPDVLWYLRRTRTESRFSALGRDVDADWQDLGYNPTTHRLTVVAADAAAMADVVVAALERRGGVIVGAREIRDEIGGKGELADAMIGNALALGRVLRRTLPGSGGPLEYRLPNGSESLAEMIGDQ